MASTVHTSVGPTALLPIKLLGDVARADGNRPRTVRVRRRSRMRTIIIVPVTRCVWALVGQHTVRRSITVRHTRATHQSRSVQILLTLRILVGVRLIIATIVH